MAVTLAFVAVAGGPPVHRMLPRPALGADADAGRYASGDLARFFAQVNVDLPGLERTRAAVRRGDFAGAMREHLRWRGEGATRPRFLFEGAEPTLAREMRASYAHALRPEMHVAERLLRNELVFEGLVYRLSDPPWYFPERPGRLVSKLASLAGLDVSRRKVLEDILVNSFQVVAPTLAVARLVTGDTRFSDKFCYYFRSWRAAASPLPDPYRRGDLTHPQAHSLFTVAARATAWIQALYLMGSGGCIDDEFRSEVLREIVAHVGYVNDSLEDALHGHGGDENRAFWYRSNNQPFVTAARQAGLLIMLPELNGAAVMLENTFRYLEHYVTTYVTAEGYQAERDSSYHMGTFVYLAEAALLASLNGVVVPGRIRERLEASFEAVVAIVQPNGYLPAVGDAELATDPSAYLALGAVLFQRQEFATLVRGPLDWRTYLTISRVGDARKVLENPGQSLALHSTALPATGFYVMRSGRGVAPRRPPGVEDDNLYLFFDLAPSVGHTHRDVLNVIVAGYGSSPPYNLLDESGVGRNWAVNPRTPYYAGARAHNVVMVDRTPTPAWVDDPAPTLRRWISTESFDFVSGGYGRAYQGTEVTRAVLFVKGEYWLLRDEIAGRGRHLVEQLFNFSPVIDLAHPRRGARAAFRLPMETKAFRTLYDGPNLLLVPADTKGLRAGLRQGWKWHETFARAGPASEGFHDVRSPTLVYAREADTSGGLAFDTVLYPLRRGEDRAVSASLARMIQGDTGRLGGSLVRVEIGTSNIGGAVPGGRGKRVDYHVRGSGGGTLDFGAELRFEGRSGFVRTTGEGELDVMCIVDGQSLAYRGTQVRTGGASHCCLRRVERRRWTVTAATPVELTLPVPPGEGATRVHVRCRDPRGAWTACRVGQHRDANGVTMRLPAEATIDVVERGPGLRKSFGR